jgi:1-acyl-sn-glycerol-3-phosphate acyltransferase
MGRFLRGVRQILLVWAFTAAFLTPILLFASVAPKRILERFRCWAIRSWGRAGLRILGVAVRVEGAEHLAFRAARVVTFNHASLLDIFVVLALLPDGGMPVVKREALRYPLIGWGVRALGILPLDRSHLARARSTLERAAERVRRDRLSAVIAPEGTRSRNGSLQPFKLGAFHLALQARAPIVPMVIANASRLLPVGSFCCRPGLVTVRVLPPIASCGYRPDDLRTEAARLMAIYERELATFAGARVACEDEPGAAGRGETRG